MELLEEVVLKNPFWKDDAYAGCEEAAKYLLNLADTKNPIVELRIVTRHERKQSEDDLVKTVQGIKIDYSYEKITLHALRSNAPYWDLSDALRKMIETEGVVPKIQIGADDLKENKNYTTVRIGNYVWDYRIAPDPEKADYDIHFLVLADHCKKPKSKEEVLVMIKEKFKQGENLSPEEDKLLKMNI
jgi:hypothetical protein